MTRGGDILGTAAYMSPEQARGLAVDKRSDIWAFGCVLFEMLTGRQAFCGDTVTDIIVSVLTRDIDCTAIPRETPPGLRRLLNRCLHRASCNSWMWAQWTGPRSSCMVAPCD
jgi:serine/threonine protein kinase